MDSLFQDLRYAWRSLRTGKGLVAVAVLSVGLGIGAVTTIFTVVDAFMLRPLPIPDGDRVVRVFMTNPERGWMETSLSHGDFDALRARSRTLDLAVTQNAGFNISGSEQPERLKGAYVSANYFDVFGLDTALGRTFTPEEEQAGQSEVVVISDALWHRRFGGSDDVVGQTLLLDSEPHVVVGVLSPSPWQRYRRDDVWKPFVTDLEEDRAVRYLASSARLRRGFTLEQAQRELDDLAAQLEIEFPESNASIGARVQSLRDSIYNQEFRTAALVASLGVLFVLLISCANAANLLLTRATARSREVAVRSALGAGRARIVKQFLAEALLIAGLGGITGAFLAWVGATGLEQLFGHSVETLGEIQMDTRVLLFCLAATLISGLVFGLSPALRGSRAPFSTLRLGSGGGEAPGGRLRRGLVVGEVALSLTLLVCSGLLIQGYLFLTNNDPGFDPDDVLTLRLTLPQNGYEGGDELANFYREVRTGLESLPGVVAVGATSALPGESSSATYYSLTPAEGAYNELPVAEFRSVIPGYFEAMDVTLLEGQRFEDVGLRDPDSVVMINQSMVNRHWPDGNAVGQYLHFVASQKEIIGVVTDSRDDGIDDEPEPMLFFSALQGGDRSLAWMIETTGPPQDWIAAATEEIHSLDPNLPIHRAMPLSTWLRDNIADEKVLPQLMIGMAGLALLLALGGVYGVMAFLVGQRTRELGIRLALGATQRNLQTLLVRQGALLTLTGVVIGVVLALAVARGLAGFLFDVSPFDLPTFLGCSLALLAAGALASWLPARRATRIDPSTSLRSE